MESETKMPEKTNITYEILEHIGVISKYDSGWNKELNIISWNGGAAKYDIRDWDHYHERMKKGITLFDGELRKLVELYLNNNSQKAVEKGRELESQRRSREEERWQMQKQAGEESVEVPEGREEDFPPCTREDASEEAYRETIPPEETTEEGADICTYSEGSSEPVLEEDTGEGASETIQNISDEIPF